MSFSPFAWLLSLLLSTLALLLSALRESVPKTATMGFALR